MLCTITIHGMYVHIQYTYFVFVKKIIIFFIYFSELEQTYVYYDPQDKGSISKMFWDYIQTNLGCCGAESK